MKTLFGMTAAVLMVVMMLVVALPGTAWTAERECDPLFSEPREGKPFLIKRGKCINGKSLNEYKTTWSYCNKNGMWGPSIPGTPIYETYEDCCNNGDHRLVKLDEFYTKDCRRYRKIEAQICTNSQWKTTSSFGEGAGNAPDGDDCIIDNCPGKCQNGVCQKVTAAAAALSAAGRECGCTVCNECERCAGKECKPIQPVSPHSPQCLTK
jgi:hypothetical protein